MSGLFGGIDLGTPADRNMYALKRELESRRDRWERPGYRYRGGADYCLQHGEFRPGRVLPDAYAHLHGLNGTTCYLDALYAAEADPRLTYCEGYASTGNGGFISHAWCVAPDNGVLEMRYPPGGGWYAVSTPNTPVLAPEHWGYWGVTFSTELARAWQEAAGLGFLDRSTAEVADMRGRGFRDDQIGRADGPWPILTVPYNRDRKDLP